MNNLNFRTVSFIFGISILIGILNELAACATRSWLYHPWWITYINLALMFGLIMPSIACLLYRRSLMLIYIAGFIFGLAYEFLDQYWLQWSSFPDNTFLIFTDVNIIRVAIAFLWGLVPMVTVILSRWNINRNIQELAWV